MRAFILSNRTSLRSLILTAILLAIAALAASASAQSYNFNTIYDLTVASGDAPYGTLAVDASGNLYGTTAMEGANGSGTVFELVNSSGTYTEQVLYNFSAYGQTGGYEPYAGLTIDNSGNLYGATTGGGAYGYGTIFELQNNGGGSYTFNLLYSFTGGSDGSTPYDFGALARDASGNLFGTTGGGGAFGVGTVFELVNSGGGSGSGSYTEQTLHSFTAASDGSTPVAGVTLDANGNLFGTALKGGANNMGTVYELLNSGGGTYTFNLLYTFTGGNDGINPYGGVRLDAAGNLYGATTGDTYGGGSGTNEYGSVYELVNSSGVYSEKTLYDFTNVNGDGDIPLVNVTLDAAGDIFGTTEQGGSNGDGTVFELVNSSGSYQEQILHSFTYGPDGAYPYASLVMDAHGNLFGGTEDGGSSGIGTLWELTIPSPTSTQLTSSLNPATSGDNVTFTAVVTATPASPIAGTVTFSEGSTTLGTAAVTNGSASVTVNSSALGVGADTITAQFAPSITSQTGSNASIVQTVNADSGVAITGGSNTFTGNQTVNGTVAATGFSGSGAGLTNVVAAGLACAGCVTNSQLGVNYAGSSTQGGAATSALNSLQLGGLPATSFATLDSNSFTGDQSINGNLTATGNLNGAAGNFSGSVSSAGFALAPSGMATSAQGYNSGALDAVASLFNSTTSTAQGLRFQWQAEPVTGTNNTANPAATLNLLYGVGGTTAETGLSVNANGTVNFAAGQTFPGTSSGTITSVTAGSGLTGGGTSGNVTLSLPANACAPGSAVTAFPFACSPFVTQGSSPSFGAITASAFSGGSFTGNGAGLTNVSAVSAATAANLTGNIGESQVTNLTADLTNGVNTAEAFATTAANAAQTSAQTFATNAAATAQTNAQTFATNATATAETNAQTFATTAAATAQTNAQTFATTAVATAETNAQSFATTAAATAQTNAETFATSLTASGEAGAVAAAETYANSTFVPLAGGTMTGTLNLPTLTASGAVTSASVTTSGPTATGSLTIGGGTPITQYLSVTLNLTLPRIDAGQCTTFETAALAGFTPGNDDTFSLGIPGAFLTGLNDNPGHGHHNQGANIFLVYQAWETSSSPATTITLQVCNPSTAYRGGGSGTIRIDVLKH